MTIALLPHRIDAISRLTRIGSVVRDTIAHLPVRRPEPSPTVNTGRWATLPDEYAGPWACPLVERFPAITAPGATLPVACGQSGSVVLHLAGTWSGQVAFEGSVDSAAWRSLSFASLTGDVTANGTDRPGLWRTLPGESVVYLRLRVAHLSHGAIHASIAAAPSVGQSIPRSLDSAA